MTDVAALIVGIDNWRKYTRPLVESIREHEPDVRTVVIDNGSKPPYPVTRSHRTDRLGFAAAVNEAHRIAGDADWTVVLSNDVRCTGPFVEMLAEQDPTIAGPLRKETHGWEYLEGWCVAIHRDVWQAVGGWDEQFQLRSWEDVDFAVRAVAAGYTLTEMPLPFEHLQQGQRYNLPGFQKIDFQNYRRFRRKHGR